MYKSQSSKPLLCKYIVLQKNAFSIEIQQDDWKQIYSRTPTHNNEISTKSLSGYND